MTELEFNQILEEHVEEKTTITVAGACLWYDYSYGKKIANMDDFHMLQKWKATMTDSNLIKGDDHIGLNDARSMYGYGKMKIYSFDPLVFFEKEKEKMLKIIEDCDIFVSHIGPVVPPDIRPEYKNVVTGFYYFDGERYLWADKAPKVWFFGHTHDKTYFQVNNTTLLCNPLGYKSENTGVEIDVVDTTSLY